MTQMHTSCCADQAVSVLANHHNDFLYILNFIFLRTGWVLIIDMDYSLFSIALAISCALLKSILIYKVCRVAVWCLEFTF